MKKNLFFIVLVTVVVTLLAGCSPKVTSTALVTVKGKIAGGIYTLDQVTFDRNSKELTYNDPTMGNGLVYKGILLKDLITLVKPTDDAKIIALITFDGKEFDITIDQVKKYDIMLARWVGGILLDEMNGGPVKVAYPDDAIASGDPAFKAENWAWWVVTVEIK